MATLSNFGVPGAGQGVLHPRLKHRYYVKFSDIGQGLSSDQIKNLMMQTVNVTLPNISWEEVAVHRYNSTAYVLGKHTFEPISLTIEDDVDGLATQVIESQMEKQQKIVGNSGAMYLPSARTASDYKFSMEIVQLDGGSDELGKWVIEGAQILSADFGDRDWSASESATITLSIRFDHAYKIENGGGIAVGTALGGFA